MNAITTLATAVLLLLFLAVAPAYSQDNKPDATPEARPSQPQEDKVEPSRDKPQQNDKAAKPDKSNPDVGKPQEQQSPRPDQKAEKKNDQSKPNETRQPEAVQPQEQHPAQQMQGGHDERPMQAGRGKRIPDDKFRASFGRQHTFHVQRSQVVNVRQPVVLYGGYSFQLVEAWPVDWGFDDVVYIDYVDDGYYLFDPLHPGIQIAVFIVE